MQKVIQMFYLLIYGSTLPPTPRPLLVLIFDPGGQTHTREAKLAIMKISWVRASSVLIRGNAFRKLPKTESPGGTWRDCLARRGLCNWSSSIGTEKEPCSKYQTFCTFICFLIAYKTYHNSVDNRYYNTFFLIYLQANLPHRKNSQ